MAGVAPGATAIPLGRPSPGASSNQPERPGQRKGPVRIAPHASLLFGFAPGGACHAADVAADAVRSYRTLSPLPDPRALRPEIRRFAFCGAFPGVAPAGRYPAPHPFGARTFLRPKAAAVQPTGEGGHRRPAAARSRRKSEISRRLRAESVRLFGNFRVHCSFTMIMGKGRPCRRGIGFHLRRPSRRRGA